MDMVACPVRKKGYDLNICKPMDLSLQVTGPNQPLICRKNESNMNKIYRTSHCFRLLFQATFVTLPLVSALYWVNAPHPITLGGIQKIGFLINFIPSHLHTLIQHPLSVRIKFLGFILALIPMGVQMMVLYYLIKLFRLYENQFYFRMDNVILIKKIGYILLLGQAVNPIYQALFSAAMTWNNLPGKRFITISFTGNNLGILLTALLVILIAWIMAEGHKLQEEQQLTI